MQKPFAVSPYLFTVNRFVWAACGLLVAVDAVWLLAAGIEIEITQQFYFALLVAICLAVIAAHPRHRDDNLCLFGHAILQFILAGAALIFLSFLSARLNFPLIDRELAAIDAWFGFDWREHVAWIERHGGLAELSTIIYNSFIPQVALSITLLFAYKQTAHAQRFLIAYLSTVLVCILVAAFLPAMGGFVFYDMDMAALAHQPVAGRLHEFHLLGMRNHTTAILSYPLTVGLLTFPSFHAAGGILFMYACLPLKRLLPWSIWFNAGMILATPFNGAHYLADLLGGIVIALAMIALAERLIPRTYDSAIS